MKHFAGCILILLALLACSQEERPASHSRLPMSWGQKQKIYVFADPHVWKMAEEPLRYTLERPIFTTFNEKEFEIEHADIEKIEQFYKFNNVIFIGDLGSEDAVSVYLKDYLSKEVMQNVQETSVGMFVKHDLWARNQLAMFLLGTSKTTVTKLIQLRADAIYQPFDKMLHKRIAQQTFRQKRYNDSAFSKYPWRMDITKNYQPYATDTANNFISFIARLRNKPDRYLAVYYEKMPREKFTRDWLKKTRARLAWDYYDEDEFDASSASVQNYTLGSYEGLRLKGMWQNKKYAVGGAFQTFGFYHEASQTAYVIDNSVYWPDGYKLPGLIELEEISKTIEIN